MTGVERRRAAGAVVIMCLLALLLLGSPGADAEDLTIDIPLPTVVRGEPGSEHLLATEEIPTDLIGMGCEVSSTAENQSSVHPGNDLVVASGHDQLMLADVEREPGAVTSTDGSLMLGEQVTVTLEMGPDGTFSAGMKIQMQCEPTTTTTHRETTTTGRETTTTEGETTTTQGETTTTGGDTTTTTSAVGEETTSTTGADETSSTTSSTSPPTTDQETTTTDTSPPPESTLPFTGGGSATMTGAAAVALAAGMGLIALTRRTQRSGSGEAHTEVEIQGIRVRLLRPGD